MNVQLERVIPATDYIIADAQAKKEWEELVGFKIHGDRVRVTRHFGMRTWDLYTLFKCLQH